MPTALAPAPAGVRGLRLGLDVNARAAGGRTPLLHLLRRGHCSPSLIAALVRAGADPRLCDDDGRDAFRHAASLPRYQAALHQR